MKVKIQILLLALIGVLSLCFLNAQCSNGCEYNGSCYEYESIIIIDNVSSYCDFSTQDFLAQKQLNESCNNDYECAGGFPCVEDRCFDVYGALEGSDLTIEGLYSELEGFNESDDGDDDGNDNDDGDDNDDDDDNNGGSSGGGGGGGLSYRVYRISDEVFKKGFIVWLEEDDRIIFPFQGKEYTLILDKIRDDEDKTNFELNPSSDELVQRTGVLYRYIISGDGYYDFELLTNEISSNGNKARVTIKYTHLSTTYPSFGVVGETDTIIIDSVDGTDNISDTGVEISTRLKLIIWILIILLILALILLVLWLFYKETEQEKQINEIKNKPIVEKERSHQTITPMTFKPIFPLIHPKGKDSGVAYDKKIVVNERKEQIKVKSDKSKILKHSNKK